MVKNFLSILPHLFIHFHHNIRLVCRPWERIAMLSFLNILKSGTKTMSRKMKQNMNITNKVWANHVYNNYNCVFHLIFCFKYIWYSAHFMVIFFTLGFVFSRYHVKSNAIWSPIMTHYFINFAWRICIKSKSLLFLLDV